MAYSNNCSYKELTAPPCWRCNHHIPDIAGCDLNNIAYKTGNNSAGTMYCAQSYEERLRDYEKKRQEYLQLSKEALVDLIIHKPTVF